ncbi:hypothetical protein CIG75_11295 [Tumebacillus algifaecis]|uniref:DnaJ homologue subfamily C member 28 conserved domain-containing protein n=1 Tax=Tumebacillus algifaecis TaxID=1214604 RepID=A0A223D1I5_9BACL|nr:DUF1992 domain-containing protein [Tumebacillus algifaecis]ASS75508.1 hypothetical protein CIG75_11295 [Tumebacillus algifaecis]
MSKEKNQFVPSEVRESSEESRYSEIQVSSWIDEAFHDFEKNGGLEGNKHKGKPLAVDDAHHSENYALHSILKNANVLPPWLELQHKIRDEIKAVLDALDSGKQVDLEVAVIPINEKIKKYNMSCPFPMQKTRIFPEKIRKQYEKWE